jgi:hypothetical protein
LFGGTARDHLNKDIFWVVVFAEMLDIDTAATETHNLLVVLRTAIEVREQTDAAKSTNLLDNGVAEKQLGSGSLSLS